MLETLRAQARARQATVILPEGDEPRVREAAGRLATDGLAHVLLVGGDAPGCERIEPALAPELVEVLRTQRPSLTEKMANRLLAKPAYFAGALVAAGRADAMVAGAAMPTRRVIEAGLMTVGLKEGVTTPSSFFLMLIPDRPLIFADCGLNVAPDADTLAAIAVASARSGQALLGAARVAMLSYSTLGSGTGAQVDRVTAARDIARALAPDLDIDGELQADTALNTVIAGRKGASGPVAGQANVLIFPSLDAGNIAYKLVQELAGAQAIGPVLQGFARPVCDLSRGATADDIVWSALIGLALGGVSAVSS